MAPDPRRVGGVAGGPGSPRIPKGPAQKLPALFFTEESRGGVHTSFRSRCHPLSPAAVEAWRWFVSGGQWSGVTKCMSSSSAA